MKIEIEKIKRIIELANERERLEREEQGPRNESGVVDLAKLVNSTAHIPLMDYLNTLTRDELIEITAILWIGSDNGDPTNWSNLLNEANNVTSIDYISSKGPLASYLQIGLVKLENNSTN